MDTAPPGPTSPSRDHRASEATTPFAGGSVRVQAVPVFLPDQSDPSEREYVFGYRVRITNSTDRIVQLLARRWTIVDANGKLREVEGEGVVGRQPILGPGQFFQYESFCPLPTPWGTMEGAFSFRAREPGRAGETASSLLDGPWPENFEARVARFYLVAAESEIGSGASARA
ncbi:MAG: Co2+/Mg2+ efflux protein ApaG [Phycisphaeraceae bacterium]|nr:Co2+/Mg2+ efflux protein ApaG [Phycisphaeraceae bacterium]